MADLPPWENSNFIFILRDSYSLSAQADEVADQVADLPPQYRHPVVKSATNISPVHLS